MKLGHKLPIMVIDLVQTVEEAAGVYKDIKKAIEVYSCKPAGGIAKIDNLIEEFFEEDKWLLKLSSRNSEGNLKIADDLI